MDKVKIGDYVEYKPVAKASSKYKVFDVDRWGESKRYFATQSGEKALKWRYMGEDEKGSILLVADRPTDDRLYLCGKDGYVNGPNRLNDLCKELYSSPLGEARSINVDDVNKVLGANPVGIYWNRKGYIVYNHENLTIGEIISIEREPALRFTLTPEPGKDINDYVINYYSYNGTAYIGSMTDEYNLIYRKEFLGNIRYWLASSCVLARFDYDSAYFIVRFVDDGCVDYSSLFNSYGGEYGCYCPVRPVVSLKSKVQFLGKSHNGVWQIG